MEVVFFAFTDSEFDARDFAKGHLLVLAGMLFAVSVLQIALLLFSVQWY